MAEKEKFTKDMYEGNTHHVKLATGGGEPIAKGHKRTDEKRVLQPRDEEGHFDYNSSAKMSRKYDYHAERNGLHPKDANGKRDWTKANKNVPSFAREMVAAWATFGGLSKGDRIVVNNHSYITSIDMSAEELMNVLENYLVDKDNEDEGHLYGSEAFREKKKGTFDSKDEKTAKAEGTDARLAGASDVNRWGNKSNEVNDQHAAAYDAARDIDRRTASLPDEISGVSEDNVREIDGYLGDPTLSKFKTKFAELKGGSAPTSKPKPKPVPKPTPTPAPAPKPVPKPTPASLTPSNVKNSISSEPGRFLADNRKFVDNVKTALAEDPEAGEIDDETFIAILSELDDADIQDLLDNYNK